MNDNVLPFCRPGDLARPPAPDESIVVYEREMSEREAKRFSRIEGGLFSTNGLDPQLGSPAEWLGTAMLYLKCRTGGERRGLVPVSMAAIDLLMLRLEELDHGGEPWRGDAA